MVDLFSMLTFVWLLALSAFSHIFGGYVSPADLLKVAGLLLAIAAVQVLVRRKEMQKKTKKEA